MAQNQAPARWKNAGRLRDPPAAVSEDAQRAQRQADEARHTEIMRIARECAERQQGAVHLLFGPHGSGKLTCVSDIMRMALQPAAGVSAAQPSEVVLVWGGDSDPIDPPAGVTIVNIGALVKERKAEAFDKLWVEHASNAAGPNTVVCCFMGAKGERRRKRLIEALRLKVRKLRKNPRFILWPTWNGTPMDHLRAGIVGSLRQGLGFDSERILRDIDKWSLVSADAYRDPRKGHFVDEVARVPTGMLKFSDDDLFAALCSNVDGENCFAFHPCHLEDDADIDDGDDETAACRRRYWEAIEQSRLIVALPPGAKHPPAVSKARIKDAVKKGGKSFQLKATSNKAAMVKETMQSYCKQENVHALVISSVYHGYRLREGRDAFTTMWYSFLPSGEVLSYEPRPRSVGEFKQFAAFAANVTAVSEHLHFLDRLVPAPPMDDFAPTKEGKRAKKEEFTSQSEVLEVPLDVEDAAVLVDMLQGLAGGSLPSKPPRKKASRAKGSGLHRAAMHTAVGHVVRDAPNIGRRLVVNDIGTDAVPFWRALRDVTRDVYNVLVNVLRELPPEIYGGQRPDAAEAEAGVTRDKIAEGTAYEYFSALVTKARDTKRKKKADHVVEERAKKRRKKDTDLEVLSQLVSTIGFSDELLALVNLLPFSILQNTVQRAVHACWTSTCGPSLLKDDDDVCVVINAEDVKVAPAAADDDKGLATLSVTTNQLDWVRKFVAAASGDVYDVPYVSETGKRRKKLTPCTLHQLQVKLPDGSYGPCRSGTLTMAHKLNVMIGGARVTRSHRIAVGVSWHDDRPFDAPEPGQHRVSAKTQAKLDVLSSVLHLLEPLPFELLQDAHDDHPLFDVSDMLQTFPDRELFAVTAIDPGVRDMAHFVRVAIAKARGELLLRAQWFSCAEDLNRSYSKKTARKEPLTLRHSELTRLAYAQDDLQGRIDRHDVETQKNDFAFKPVYAQQCKEDGISPERRQKRRDSSPNRNKPRWRQKKRRKRIYRRRRALKRLRDRERRLVDGIQRRLVSRLTTTSDIVIMPTFDTAEMVKRGRGLSKAVRRSMGRMRHGALRNRLVDQSHRGGRCTLLFCNEGYTTQLCTACATLSTPNDRVWRCKNMACDKFDIDMPRDPKSARAILIKTLLAC